MSSMTAVGWTRLEPVPRDPTLATGLAAGVADPLWLLARQWQFGELTGEDAGTPATVNFEHTTTRITRYLAGATPGTGGIVPDDIPLDALIDSEPEPGDQPRPLFAGHAGLQFLIILSRLPQSAAVDRYRQVLATTYPLKTPSGTGQENVALRLLARRSFDGQQLYDDLCAILRPTSGSPSPTPIPDDVRPAAVDYLAWFDAATGRDVPSGRAWRSDRMEYNFQLAVPRPSGETVLQADEATDRLDWANVDALLDRSLGSTTADLPNTSVTERHTIIPTPVTYPGAPAPRFFEFEDNKVDFGSVTAAPEDLTRLLVLEFALRYGNDAYLIPLPIPVGTISDIARLLVTDTFGLHEPIPPVAVADGPDGAFRLFETSVRDANVRETGFLLFPALDTLLRSDPFETVHLLRDERADLCWAIEQTAIDDTGTVRDRTSHTERADAGPQPEPQPPGAIPTLRYALRTSIPDNWYPLLPVSDERGSAVVVGTVEQLPGQPPSPPWGRLLADLAPALLPAEEITRAGVRLNRTWRFTRTTRGRQLLWTGRVADPDHPLTGSGLQYDTTTNIAPAG
jgi:hypothetical protein